MKLHRLMLTNYRGIAHREVHLPDSGVVVICGANEIGKTSMIEALDLLLESKDRSTKKDVKQIKPTHLDVGSEVLAEISTGPYRFVYRKRFHKKCETELTIMAPRREQLTGDEAHERVLAILGETVDTQLWHAQRVLQTGSMAAVDLSGCDALSRALDVAAGGTAELSGSEPLLLERIDAEYGKYFTGTGRPTGDWAAAIAALAKADCEVAVCEAALSEVDERVRRHVELKDRLGELAGLREAAQQRAVKARQQAEVLAELRKEVANANLVVTAARATSEVSAAAHSDRRGLRTELNTRTAALSDIQAELARATEAESGARVTAETATAAADESARTFEAAQARADHVRAVVDMLLAREDADRLDARLQRISATERGFEQAAALLSDITLTEEVMRDIEMAATLVQRLEAQLSLAATTVEFTATTDIELWAGGERIRLATGETWSPGASPATTVELPGQLTVQIRPGANASDIQEKLAAAQLLLDEVLGQGRATDVNNAREIDVERRRLTHDRDRMRDALRELIGVDRVADLAAQLVELRKAQPVDPALAESELDLPSAKRELADAAQALAHAYRAVSSQQQLAAEAGRKLVERISRTSTVRQKVVAAQTEIDTARERLAQRRAEISDDAIATRAAVDAEAQFAAEAQVAVLAKRLADSDPAAVDAEFKSATDADAALCREHADAERALKDIAVELAVIGTEGRQGNLDAAQTAREHAATQHARISGRARSARLLRAVMTRHRDNTRQNYVAPFRTEIERLGRPVFGPSFEVEVDSDLRICNRTVEGRTVPYDSLSGGAKEQLGILARLAGSALVAKEDSVPVVIDDALGFTDPDRLVKMGAVFDTLADHGQVIVLTCTPTRYLGIEDAHVIELTAAG